MEKTNRTTPFILFLLITGLLSTINCKTIAQSSTANSEASGSLSINMSATELVPADVIIFNININAEAKTPKAAFDIHKEREALLSKLLKEFEIKETDIKFQPIRINKRTNYNNNREDIVQTNQQVSVSFSDFDIYEQIQLTLIENDFNSFSGQFSSSEIEDGKTKALDLAILKAKERAEFIAKQSGVSLGAIKNISYSDHQISRPRVSAENSAFRSSSDSMMDFAQTVSVTANISIEFWIAPN